MWSRTKEIFRKRPLLMNMVSFGTMYVGAEMVQQTILMKMNPESKKSIDWSIVGRYAIIGWAGIGPALFYWFRYLDAVLPAVTRAVVIRKVLTDQLVSSPVCIAMFFTGMSVLEGKEDIFAELKAKFWSTYKMSCCFWLPAQAINFALLPPYTRVAFVGAASFVWVNVLCLVKRQEFTDNPATVTDEVAAAAASVTQQNGIGAIPFGEQNAPVAIPFVGQSEPAKMSSTEECKPTATQNESEAKSLVKKK